MTNKQPAAGGARESDPESSRPHFPASYGVPKRRKGILSWNHAEEQLAGALNYWIGTTSPDGTPHAVPVWGVWFAGRLFFGGDPQTRTARNLARNPAVVVHLERADEVVILKGLAEVVTDRSLLRQLAQLGARKYGGPEPGDDAGAGGESAGHPVFAVVPHTAFAWSAFPKDATRWRFPRD